MAQPDTGDAVLAELAAGLAGQIGRRYRIDSADVVDHILENWRRQPRLVAAAAAAGSASAASRLRVYKDAASVAKRDVYQRLRRYRSDPAQFDAALQDLGGLAPGVRSAELDERLAAVALAHVSTAERMPHRDDFRAVLLAALSAGDGRVDAVVADVGCGVMPLMFPSRDFDGLGIGEYWALDKDPHAEAALREYARLRGDNVLRPVEWQVADGWPAAFAAGMPERCDVGLLLKVVPVIARQAPALLPVLAATPADRLLISGSRIAMARREDIERRERRLLQRFCAESGLRIAAESRTEDEFFLLVSRA